jgi:hypothetical protein
MDMISVHVPKSAGSTFGNFLTTVYGVDRVFKDYDDYPMNPLSPINLDREAWRISADEQVRAISSEFVAVHGHFVIEKYQGFFPEARRIAWVRHPAAWVISLYYFWKNKPKVHNAGTNPLIRRLHNEDLALLDFAEDPTIRDCISRVFLGGLPPEEYDFLGIQEHFNTDIRDLVQLMGWPALEPGFENQNPEPAYGERLMAIHQDSQVVDRLIALNEGDMSLYETALKLRNQRIEARQAESDRHNPRCTILSGIQGHQADQSRVA